MFKVSIPERISRGRRARSMSRIGRLRAATRSRHRAARDAAGDASASRWDRLTCRRRFRSRRWARRCAGFGKCTRNWAAGRVPRLSVAIKYRDVVPAARRSGLPTRRRWPDRRTWPILFVLRYAPVPSLSTLVARSCGLLLWPAEQYRRRLSAGVRKQKRRPSSGPTVATESMRRFLERTVRFDVGSCPGREDADHGKNNRRRRGIIAL